MWSQKVATVAWAFTLVLMMEALFGYLLGARFSLSLVAVIVGFIAGIGNDGFGQSDQFVEALSSGLI